MKKRQTGTVKLSKDKLLRAVASSTAIETGQSIQSVEEKLQKELIHRPEGINLNLDECVHG